MKKLFFDLNDPIDARKFLKYFRTIQGHKILYMILENGKRKISLEKASDEQITTFAKKVYEDLYSEGRGYLKEEEAEEYLH